MSDEMKNTKSAAENVHSDETEQLYEKEFKRVQENMKARADAIRESMRVSDRDLQIVINARG